MIHLDPDFKSLTNMQREIALKSIYSLAKHGDVNRISGITQLHLIHAIGSTLLGLEMTIEEQLSKTLDLDELENQMEEVDETVRHRLFQLFTLVELILDPMPLEATQALKQIAKSLNVNDEFIEIAREYSQGAYGIAASDLARKGYMGNPDLIKKGSTMMRVNKILTDPFELDEMIQNF